MGMIKYQSNHPVPRYFQFNINNKNSTEVKVTNNIRCQQQVNNLTLLTINTTNENFKTFII